MSEPRLVDPGEVVMTGENSFIRLSGDGGTTIADRVSHWRVLWSPAGQGHALFIDSPLTGKGPRVYSDNIGMTRYLQRRIEAHLHAPFGDAALPVLDARFERSGNSLATVEERVSTDDGEILLAWWDLLPAFVITVPAGQMNRPIGVYSTFFPARAAQLSFNGQAATARPFAQDRSGKASSSCVLAWSETWVGGA
jgi:hypothetical protein